MCSSVENELSQGTAKPITFWALFRRRIAVYKYTNTQVPQKSIPINMPPGSHFPIFLFFFSQFEQQKKQNEKYSAAVLLSIQF